MSTQGTDQDTILVIDNSEDVTLPLKSYFEQRGVEVLISGSMDAGLQMALKHHPSLILLAASLGNVDGLEIFRRLRKAPLTAHIPVMFIADFKDAMRQNQLLSEGADDVIARPFDVEILALRIRNAIQRTRREGLTDSITGLPTMILISEKLADMAEKSGWTEMNITIEHFDSFRARYDFITGNEVLRYAAKTLAEIVATEGEEDFAGCPSEARFVVITSTERADTLAEKITAQLGEQLLQFYNFMERDQGYVEIEDGQGGTEQRPLMAVQIERVTH